MRSRKRRWRRMAVITVVALFVAAVVLGLLGPHDPAVMIVITGTPGTKFRGTIEVDGVPREITGEVPTEFHFRGCRFAWGVKMLDVADLPAPDAPQRHLHLPKLGVQKVVNGERVGRTGNFFVRVGVTGGLVIEESGLLLFGKFPVGKVDAGSWDSGINVKDPNRELILSPDAGTPIWTYPEPRPPDGDERA